MYFFMQINYLNNKYSTVTEQIQFKKDRPQQKKNTEIHQIQLIVFHYNTQSQKQQQIRKRVHLMSIEEKQQYLRKEIVDNGLDAEQFYEFWQTFGIDLNNATMDDVVSIVTEFQTSNQKKQEEEDQFGDYVEPVHHQHHQDSNFYQDMNWDFLADKPNENKEQKDKKQQTGPKHKKQEKPSKKQQPNLLDTSPTKLPLREDKKSKISTEILPTAKVPKQAPLISLDQSNNINNVTFQQVIKDSQSVKKSCLKLQPNILEHHANVQIFITKYKEITEQSTGIINKLWKGTYLLFTIKTIGRNKQKAIGISWEVQRQHTDFQWLRNTMIKMHPGLVVPPLPALVKQVDQLNGYQRKLESFLLDSFNCPELRNSKYFQVFLSYASAKDFEVFKKNCENASKPKTLDHVLNMQGQISLLYSDKLDGYSEGLQNFLTKTSLHLKNVKTLIKQIDEFYSSISIKYKQLSEVFTKMSEQSLQFSEEECYPKLTQTYKQISQLVNHHSYFCMLEKEFLETFMFSHFAYEKDRVENMQSLIARRKTFTTQFAKPKHQVEKPIQSTGTSVFGKIAGLFGEKISTIDVPASDTVTLRDQVGYYNSQLLKQSIRCVQGMIASHVNHFSTYGHSRIDNVQEMQKLWSKILVELSKLSRK